MGKNGYIIPNTPISVDYWHVLTKPFVRYFFLTHCHADHTNGLSNKWRRRIFCSQLTAKLASQLFQIEPRYFVPIEENETLTIDYDDDKKCVKRSFHVTALDADHCPGAVMFLFDGWFGRILCTGDFRYEIGSGIIDVDRLQLHPIDRVYLDATNQGIEELPRRSDALREAVRIIEERPSEEIILLAMPQAKLGKEALLKAISLRFKQKICVDSKRMEIAPVLQMEEYFTNDWIETRFRLVGGSIKKISEACAEYQACGNSVFVLFLTSLSIWRSLVKSGDQNACRDLPFGPKNAAFIPYSDHSSGKEIEAFQKMLDVKEYVWIGQKNKTARNEEGRVDPAICANQFCFNGDDNHLEPQPNGIRSSGRKIAVNRPSSDAVLSNKGQNLDRLLVTEETNFIFTDSEIEALLLVESLAALSPC